ncbi:MAG: hypothetical protein JJ858_06605 [Rhizobiaceae bacterium]|nr:hypothetical protein [Rhizobiaceae bacterium]
MIEYSLTPLVATIIFVIACLAGYQYRRVFKAEGPTYQLWIFGIIAASSLLILGFIPIKVG